MRQVLWSLLLLSIASCGGLGTSDRYSICRKCGLSHWEHYLTWYGTATRQSVVNSSNPFNSLYRALIPGQCKHQWTQTSRSWINISGGGVACGVDHPLLFDYDHLLPPLRRLHDRSKAAKLLTSYDQSYGPLLPINRLVIRSLRELKTVKTLQDEQRWWGNFQAQLHKVNAHPNCPM